MKIIKRVLCHFRGQDGPAEQSGSRKGGGKCSPSLLSSPSGIWYLLVLVLVIQLMHQLVLVLILVLVHILVLVLILVTSSREGAKAVVSFSSVFSLSIPCFQLLPDLYFKYTPLANLAYFFSDKKASLH